MLEESFKVVSRMFQGSFKGIPTKIEGCFQIPPRELQVSVSKRSSNVFQVSFKAVLKTFYGSFKSILCQLCFKKI